MATDIIARGMAAGVKKSVTELGDKIESEKWIGTKEEWEAVDKSTIKDGTIVYITDDETVILYDKAEMEKIATQVAADRTAAETAAQTAQSIADSLPDDYTTAVGKIAENTAEIDRVKLTDKELKRRVDALYDMGQGITHQFETDSETAYQKAVPTGAKLMSVKSVGGRSIVWNQLAPCITAKTSYGIAITVNDDSTINLHGTVSETPPYKQLELTGQFRITLNGHKCLYRFGKNTTTTNQYGVCGFGTKGISSFIFSNNSGIVFAPIPYINVIEGDVIDIDNMGVGVLDLTQMFGAGNEPASVEEFEKMFPNDYYPYCAGEIVSAGVTEVAVGDTAYHIPEAIRNLPGYGVEGNVVDYEAKTYTQNNTVEGTEVKALDTPIVTDISTLIPDDFLRNLTVEAGGSITFKGGNDDYRIPVPSEEEYVVKLSEIGGTT